MISYPAHLKKTKKSWIEIKVSKSIRQEWNTQMKITKGSETTLWLKSDCIYG